MIVSPDGGGFSAATDIALANLGPDAAGCPFRATFPVYAETLRNSDLVAVLPERLVRGQSGLVVVEPPLAVAGFEMLMLWHERWHRDPAHQWLRQFIVIHWRNRHAEWTESPDPGSQPAGAEAWRFISSCWA